MFYTLVPPKVLVVDDEPAVARALAHVLSSSGFDVVSATSAHEAIALAAAQQFALVVTDVRMPEMGGLALVDHLAPQHSGMRFVLVTGATDLDLVAGCTHLRAVRSVIQKPWHAQEVVAVVREALASAAHDIASDAGRPPVVLFVEDNEGDVDLACEYLSEAGTYRLEHVARLTDALDLLSRERVDVVLTDLSLPDAAGLDCVRRLSRAAPDAAVIVLSGQADEQLALQAIEMGVHDYLVKGQVSSDLLRRAVGRARERKRAEQRLARLARTDALTGVANRTAFLDHVALAISRARRRQSQLALLFVDIDAFKAVNDTYGHDAGDRFLAEVAARMTRCIRPSDVVARLGGDEFGVLLDDVHGTPSVTAVVERVRAEFAAPIVLADTQLPIMASIGIAFLTETESDGRALLAAADTAMYSAKRRGPNQYEVYRRPVERNCA